MQKKVTTPGLKRKLGGEKQQVGKSTPKAGDIKQKLRERDVVRQLKVNERP